MLNLFIKELIKKIILKEKYDSKSFVAYLRKQGMKIGDGTVVFTPAKVTIDTTRPWLIEIGNDVQITQDVTILTHGYDWTVLKGLYNEVLGSSGKVTIGNNVFIGMKTTVLKGVTIGNNVVIGANSLVNKDIPDNCVAAGNPAKVIMSIEDYYEKRKNAQVKEAAELVAEYRKAYGKEPDEYALKEFFGLFSNGENLPECWDHMLSLVGNHDESLEKLKKTEHEYKDMQDFLSKV